jgi:DNA-directed RNA polymerase specialized sigma24 family protein
MEPLLDRAVLESRAAIYARLHDDLARWLRARCEASIDIENIAGDTMLLAITECPICPIDEPHRVWGWLCATALHRVNDARRAAHAHPVELRPWLDDLVAAAGDDASATQAVELLAELRRVARGVPREVLDMLDSGEQSNAAMARRKGISVRAIERARQRLRELLCVLRAR